MKTEHATELTDLQKETLGFIKGFIQDQGYAPTISDLSEIIGISPNAVVCRLKSLESKKAIKRTPGIARGIKVF